MVLAAVLGAGSVWAQDAAGSKAADDASLKQAFVSVNGEAQSRARAEVLLREQLARGAPDSAELRAGVRQALVLQAVLAQEARKQGLDNNPLVQAQMEMAQQSVLVQAWQQKVLADAPVTDDDVKKQFDAEIARLSDKDFQIRHILVREETSAKLLLEKVKAGSKIADLAREYSVDASTRERGGLAEWSNGANILPALTAAAKDLRKGQTATAAVRTDAGWHVLQLEDVRPAQLPKYDEVKAQVRAGLLRKRLETRIQELVAQAKVQ